LTERTPSVPLARVRPEWLEGNEPSLAFGLVALAAAVAMLVLGWQLTFFQDTWSFLLDRQGVSVSNLLSPHNEHLVLLPVAINKLALAVFGMGTARPEMVLMTLTVLACGALVFVYVRRRIGPWPALMAATLMLFLGSAWEVVLWPFEIEFTGALMAGLATMLVLERDDRRGDAWACLLLTVAIGFGSLGLSFAAAALVDVFQKRWRRDWRRLYVVAVPLVLYLAWYAGWGHDAEHHLTIHNILLSPQYVFDGFASAVDSLAGLSSVPVNAPGQPEWGRPLLIALIALAIYGQRRKPGLSPHFWPAAAAGLSYWLLAAFNFIPGREAASTRYVYAGAAFVLLIAATLLQGVRLSRRALWIGAALTLLALGPNLAQLKDGANWLKEQSVLTRADTAAMEIAGRTIPPQFTLTPDVAGTASLTPVNAGQYFEAVAAHGSSAYTVDELAAAPQVGRYWADVVLSKALPLTTLSRPQIAPPRDAASCAKLPGGAGMATPQVQLRPGLTRVWVAPGPEAPLRLRRFATGMFPADLGALPGGSLTLLRIPRDGAAQPWFVQVQAQQPAWVCG
jgi:hypothetical protein